MKGIYLTQEGKKEIEDRISHYETMMGESWSYQTIFRSNLSGRISMLKEILSTSPILPSKVVNYNKHYPKGLITIIKEK
jgi:hypothetical protein